MTVRELEKILNNFPDDYPVVINLIDEYAEFTITNLELAVMTDLKAIVIDTVLPESFYVGEK